MTIGIKWLDDNLVPEDEKKWLVLALRGFVRHKFTVRMLPDYMGGFHLTHSSGPDRKAFFDGKHVAILVDNPNSTGISDDGNKPALQKQPASQEQRPPGFGWDPGYGDD